MATMNVALPDAMTRNARTRSRRCSDRSRRRRTAESATDPWTLEFLGDFPFAAPERPELMIASRGHPYRRHIIVYRLDGPDILVQRVRQTSEDWIDPA